MEIDFTQHREPFNFIREAMEGYSEQEIQDAHENYCEFLNLLVRVNEQIKEREKKEVAVPEYSSDPAVYSF